MILAAGRGERMRPLSDFCPKPLLQIQGKPLMQWPMEALAAQGFGTQLVNTAWLGEQIEAYLHCAMDSGHWPLACDAPRVSTRPTRLHLSKEGQDFGTALETAGGICRALPYLAEVFWVVAGDVFMPDFRFSRQIYDEFASSEALAHLWLVPNPPHHPRGDFGIANNGLAQNLTKDAGCVLYTFSTVALYKRALFLEPHCAIPSGNPSGIKAALAPLLRATIDQGLVTASLYQGRWTDVGTPQRLAEMNAMT